LDWIVRFIRFHNMRSREHLSPAEAKIESFLTDLAVHTNVAPATQNQAMNALVFLYKRVLKHSSAGRPGGAEPLGRSRRLIFTLPCLPADTAEAL
jgi:hypothetical protein